MLSRTCAARARGWLALPLLLGLITGCSDNSSTAPPSYPVGGTIYGFTTTGLTLQNGTDTLRLATGAASFTFPTRLPSGATYLVTVSQQPAGLTCAVHGGSGTVGTGTAATTISVYCASGQEFVYTGGNLFDVDPVGGALSLSATTVGCCLLAIADPLGHFLYAVDQFSAGLNSYAIDPATGFLNPLVQVLPPAPGGFTSLAIDPSGSFLYATVAQQAFVYAYAIGAGGTLTALPLSPFPAGSFPVALAIDVEHANLYAANSADGTISGYAIGADGTLTPLLLSPFPAVARTAGLDAIVTAPAGGYLYAHAGVGTGTGIYAFSITPQSGALVPLPGNPFSSPQVGSSALAIGPTGQFIFLANQMSNTMSVSTIAANTGLLLPAPGNPFPGGGITGQIAPDPTGRFVYTAGNASVSGFLFDSIAGSLTVLPTSPYLSGPGSYVLVVRPSP